MSDDARVLYIVACAAPPARQVHVLIDEAKDRGWQTCLITTPSAYRWLDIPSFMERTGYPVRVDHRMPGEPDVLPSPDAIVIAPATFNTLNKWANGITDNLALGLICESIGVGIPLVALPYMNAAQARHPALLPNVERLRSAGVTVLFGDDVYPLHEPRQGGQHEYPWTMALDAVNERSRS